MKLCRIFVVMILMISILLIAGCSSEQLGQDSASKPSKPGNTENGGGIHIDVNFNLNITVDEGKDAGGFTWENNYSEITITGYIGASNELTVPHTINGKPVTLIQEGALKGFSGLKSIVIPGSVKSIAGVFEDCTNLETVVIAESGLEDMTAAFKNCTALKTVNVPTTVKEMEGAFEGCAKLESEITVPAGVTSVRNAFHGCAALKKVVMHDGVEDLSFAFSGCSALKEVEIPAAANDLDHAFENCASLKSIRIPDGITELTRSFAGCISLESVMIPDGMEELDHAFEGCSSLQSVDIPDSVTYLYGAFGACSSLESVRIPSNVVNLVGAFADCTALENVSFAGTDYRLDAGYGDYSDYETGVTLTSAFDGCISLKRLELPEGIGLYGYGCFALEELIIHIRDTGNYWEDTDALYVQPYQYLYFCNLPALKNVEFVSDLENVDVKVDLVADVETTYTVFTGGTVWYEKLLGEAQLAANGSYRYYTEKLDDGTMVRRLSEVRGKEVTVIEETVHIRGQVITTRYTPALIDKDNTPVVVEEKTIEWQHISIYRPGEGKYADAEYQDCIVINGVEYSVYVYDNTEDDEW